MPDPSPYTRVADIRSVPRADTVVWRGQVPETGQRCVIKEARTDADGRTRARIGQKLLQEVVFFQGLAHPRLVRPVAWDEDAVQAVYDDAQFSLAGLLAAEGRLQPRVVAVVVRQALEGLSYLHANGFGHGSLNPHALWLTPAGDIKLADFLGYRFTNDESPHRPDYSVRYQAPELIDPLLEQQFGAGPGANPRAVRADLYCLGYTAVELLLGPDFDRHFRMGQDSTLIDADATWLSWHGDVLRAPPELPALLPEVPGGFRALLGSLIQKAPAGRARLSAQGVLDDLARCGMPVRERLGEYREDAPPRPSPSDVLSLDSIPTFEPVPEYDPVTLDDPVLTSGSVPDLAVPPVPLADDRTPLVLAPAGRNLPGGTFPPGGTVVVGSHPGCDVRVNHASISQRHALFACQPDGTWWVYDLRSRFGTFVNGEQVPVRPLADGDGVRLGELDWRVGLPAAAPPRRPAAPAERHTQFGEFVLLRKIHHGKSGRLYQALWPKKANREVALRRFPTGFQSDEAGLRRLMERLPQAAKIRHKNVARLYHAGFYTDTQRQRRWFLVMEYLAGGSLRDRLRGRADPMPAGEVIRFATEIAAALDAAGGEGLVHRNINPACVLFDAQGRAKLGDFFFMRPEVAESFQDITRGAETPADIAYQSPERLRSAKQLTGASDIYSLAACMYEALTLRPPFESRDVGFVEVVTKITAETPPPPRDLNPRVPTLLNDLVMSALEKSPAARPQSPQGFLAFLAAAGEQARRAGAG